MGEPLPVGAVHVIITSAATTDVDGGAGWSGLNAAIKVTTSEKTDKPNAFLAYTLNLYVEPLVSPVAS